jgi:hypothetical protein
MCIYSGPFAAFGNGWEEQMSKHLTEDQIAKCCAGQCTGEERQHIQECTACAAELARLAGSISLFRSAIRDRVDARVAMHTPVFEDRPPVVATPMWNWALVAAVVFLLGILPLSITKPKQFIENTSIATDPDTLMREVNLHLSRTLPAPMEPIMTLIPKNELVIQSGGVQ